MTQSLSLLAARLRDIYQAPQSVYAAVRENGGEWYDWVVPTLLAAAFWASYNWGLIGDPQDLTNWDALSEEERLQASDALVLWRSHVWFSLPLTNSFASLSAGALVLVPLVRWILRREVTLRQMLAVKGYAAMMTIPRWLLLAVFHRLGAENVAFGPAAFLNPADREDVVGQILVGLDFFDLWQAVVMGVGLAVMSGRSPRAGIAMSIGLWLLWIILGSMTSALPTAPPM
jgi:hypothetical protein